MTRFVRFFIYVFAAWFVWASWRAMPHFSGGLEEGLAYYRDQASEVLEECSAAGKRVTTHLRSTFESFRYSSQMTEERPASRYRKLNVS